MMQGAPRFLVLQSSQEQEWNGVLAQVAQHDFYHLAEYHRLAEERGEGSAHLFAYHDGAYTIALPLLLRPVEPSGGEAWSDATSVYGYAGLLASHAGMPAAVVRSFQKGLKEALAARRVVTVFSRVHPLIPQRGMLAGLGEQAAGRDGPHRPHTCARGTVVAVSIRAQDAHQEASARGSRLPA